MKSVINKTQLTHLILLISMTMTTLYLASPPMIFAQEGGSGVNPQFDGVPFEPKPDIPGFDSTPSEQPLQTSKLSDDQVRNLEVYQTLVKYVEFFSIGVGIVLGVSGAYAGLQIAMSRGNPGKTAAAVQRITYILIAAVLYIFSFAIFEWLVPGGVI